MWQLFCKPIIAIYLIFSSSYILSMNVVTTIKPIQIIAADIMQGVAEPQLLVAANQDPHQLHLKPSQQLMLNQADIIILIDEQFETFLQKPLANLPDTHRIKLSQTPGLTLLNIREGGLWENHDHAHDDHHEHSTLDFHIWLSPDNALLLTQYIADVLSDVDPDNAEMYQTNSAQLIQKIAQRADLLQIQLAPIKNKPYIVFHDAYQYFEDYYDLNAVGSITLEPQESASAKRLTALRNRIKEQQIECVFSEPGYSSRLVDTVIENTSVQHTELDPLGINQTGDYLLLIQTIADSLVACLSTEDFVS